MQILICSVSATLFAPLESVEKSQGRVVSSVCVLVLAAESVTVIRSSRTVGTLDTRHECTAEATRVFRVMSMLSSDLVHKCM